MKTEPDGDRVARLSRRAFVVGAGSAVAASTPGTAAGAGEDDRTLSVEATAPYLATVRDIARAFEADAPRARVTVSETAGSPTGRVRGGPADVLVTGNPAPTAPGTDGTARLNRGVTVQGWATLAARDSDWRESLRGRALTDAVTTGPPVDTWSESDWESVAALEDGTGGDGESQCAGLASSGDGRTTLVRGSRAYQYARGRGGVGYYEVSGDDVGAPSATRDRGDDVVPLVRLAYVYVDEASLDRPVTGSFLESYLGHTPPADDLTVDAVPEFDDGQAAIRA